MANAACLEEVQGSMIGLSEKCALVGVAALIEPLHFELVSISFSSTRIITVEYIFV